MIDLISKNQNELLPEEAIFLNSLVNKYVDVLNELSNYEKRTAAYLAYVLEISVNHIKGKYPELDNNWKTWTATYIKRIYYKKGFDNENQIQESIDSFIKYYNDEYLKYQESTGFSGGDYEKENQFVNEYMNR